MKILICSRNLFVGVALLPLRRGAMCGLTPNLLLSALCACQIAFVVVRCILLTWLVPSSGSSQRVSDRSHCDGAVLASLAQGDLVIHFVLGL